MAVTVSVSKGHDGTCTVTTQPGSDGKTSPRHGEETRVDTWRLHSAAVAQLVEPWFCKPAVVGSTPTCRAVRFARAPWLSVWPRQSTPHLRISRPIACMSPARANASSACTNVSKRATTMGVCCTRRQILIRTGRHCGWVERCTESAHTTTGTLTRTRSDMTGAPMVQRRHARTRSMCATGVAGWRKRKRHAPRSERSATGSVLPPGCRVSS